MTNKEAQLALANLKRYISGGGAVDKSVNKAIDMAIEALSKPEPHWIPVDLENNEPHEIGYDDCANALLKMWMDNVLTDGEYYRIADKLNVKWGKTELPEPYKGVTG